MGRFWGERHEQEYRAEFDREVKNTQEKLRNTKDPQEAQRLSESLAWADQQRRDGYR